MQPPPGTRFHPEAGPSGRAPALLRSSPTAFDKSPAVSQAPQAEDRSLHRTGSFPRSLGVHSRSADSKAPADPPPARLVIRPGDGVLRARLVRFHQLTRPELDRQLRELAGERE